MRIEEVENILLDFYDGKITESQETMLRDFFSTHDVPDYLEKEKRFFLSLHSLNQIPEPEGLEEKLIHLIDEKGSEGIKVLQRNHSRRDWRWISGVAAGILLILTLGVSLTILGLRDSRPKDTFTDPREAYLVMQNALIEVSANLNNGIDQLTEAKKEFVEINNEIKEEIQ
ncbi:MAG: hypothetical protein LUH22_19375 [Bacteroides sp.]|nr:hypothetical protein [Bacteroides sp.]